MSSSYEPKKRGVIFGAAKTGKTMSLARVPKGSKAYVVDADRQLGSFVALWKKLQGSVKNLEIVQLKDCADDTPGEQQRTFKDVRKALWSPPKGFDFYYIDSYTKIVQMLTHAICGKGERKYNQFNNQRLSSAANDFWQQFVTRVEYHNPNAWCFTVMHEKWTDIDDGMTDPNDLPQMITPKCGTSAEVMIPGSCDFVWHTEKGKRVEKGRSTSATFYRTRGTSTIMASSVGFDDVLEDLEFADLGAVISKMGFGSRSRSKGREVSRRR